MRIRRKQTVRFRPDPVTSDSRPSSPFPFLDAVPQTGRSLRKRTRAASRTTQTPHATTRGGHSSGASKRRQGASSGRYPSETVSLLRRPAQTGLHSDAGRWSPPVSSACAVRAPPPTAPHRERPGEGASVPANAESPHTLKRLGLEGRVQSVTYRKTSDGPAHAAREGRRNVRRRAGPRMAWRGPPRVPRMERSRPARRLL